MLDTLKMLAVELRRERVARPGRVWRGMLVDVFTAGPPPYSWKEERHTSGCRLKRSRTSGAMKMGMSCFSAAHQGLANWILSGYSIHKGCINRERLAMVQYEHTSRKRVRVTRSTPKGV